MSKKPTEAPKKDPIGNADKPVENWVTGDEPMTGAQASCFKTLSEEAGVEFEPELSKAEAAKRIDALQEKTGRGWNRGHRVWPVSSATANDVRAPMLFR